MLRMPSMSQAALLLVASLVFCLVVMEGLVRAFVPVRNVGPSFTTYDPVYGKRLKENFDADRLSPEFEMRFSTNSLGFRGPEIPAIPDGAVLFVGDSFTMGYGVSDGKEFPALLDRRLAAGGGGVPVVNLGMGDNGNGRALKYLRDEAAGLAPRLVVLQLHWNDFIDNLREGLFALDVASGELVELEAPPAGKAQRVQAWIEAVPGLSYSHLVGLARQFVTEALWARSAPMGRLSDAERAARDRLTYRLIEELYALCAERGWPVVALAVGIGEERLFRLRALGEGQDIDLIAVPGRKKRPDLYYDVDGHWTEAGHAHVADLIAAWLKANRDVWAGRSAGS